MPVSELSELRSELSFLNAQLQLYDQNPSGTSRGYRDLQRRIRRLHTAIAIHKASSSWRTQPVYVIARSKQEALPLAKTHSWNTKREARAHLRIVRSGAGDNWVTALSYRVWRIVIYRRMHKSEIISAFVTSRRRKKKSVSR